jgi:hypothetical protein
LIHKSVETFENYIQPEGALTKGCYT